jgi:drug/metabolite transporter (DMT)-like permease
MRTKDWLLFGLLGVVWGSSFLWIKFAVTEVNPLTLVSFRVLFAFLGLAAVLLAVPSTRKGFPPTRSMWLTFAILGLTNIVLPFILISWSEQFIDSGVAAILNSTVPLFTILIAPFFIPEERLALPSLAGLLTGFIGVVILMSPDLAIISRSNLMGQGAMLLAACLYAGSAVFARRRTQGLSPAGQSAMQLFTAVLIMWVITPIVNRPLQIPTLPLTWAALVWLGLIGSCLGTLLYYALLHAIGPTRTTLTSYIFPLVGVVLGMIFLDEHPGANVLLGGALIISGIVVVNTVKTKNAGITPAQAGKKPEREG